MDTRILSECNELRAAHSFTDDEEDDGEYEWTRQELADHFQFGLEFFGGVDPFAVEKAQVHASVLTTLLLLRVGEDHGQRQLAYVSEIWDWVFSFLLDLYMP